MRISIITKTYINKGSPQSGFLHLFQLQSPHIRKSEHTKDESVFSVSILSGCLTLHIKCMFREKKNYMISNRYDFQQRVELRFCNKDKRVNSSDRRFIQPHNCLISIEKELNKLLSIIILFAVLKYLTL